VRRHLSLSPEEWDDLPWWQQKMYLDGMVAEELVVLNYGPSDPTVTHTEVHRSGGTTITDRKHEQTFSGEPGEMAGFGLRVQSL
jgi:hypothetical protein